MAAKAKCYTLRLFQLSKSLINRVYFCIFSFPLLFVAVAYILT